MAMKPALWFLLLSAVLGCSAHERCTKATEFVPALCPLRLPRIVDVRIEQNGAKADAAKDDPADCTRFHVDADVVRRFFASAKAVDEHAAHHTLDWSPCYASGTLKFAGGATAHWDINELRTGDIDTGTTARQFVYCPTCRFKPFPAND